MDSEDQLPTAEDEPARTAAGVPPLDTVDPIAERHALGGVLERMFGEKSEPTRVGRYVIERRLGAGAMGVVYLAHDPQLDRRVAIKLLRSKGHAGPTDSERARLEREARSLARVRHPNVVAIHDVGLHDDQVFVVMEYVEGSTLEQRLGPSDAPPPWREGLGLMVAAGRGLWAAHEAGLVHRDFKPTNVLVGARGRVQVTDFGLAQEVDPHAAAGEIALGETPHHNLTTVGTVMGTPAFMAPELLRGEPADARSDQFAFCVTLWRALFGELPFDQSTMLGLAEATAQGPPPPPDKPRIPRWLLQVLRRGLDPEPSRRFGSMRALLHQLERRRGVVGWGPIVGAVALVVAGVVVVVGKRGPPLCKSAPEHLARVWNDARRDRVDQALRATGVEYAAATVAPVTAALDRYGEDWATMHTEACRATSVRGEQSPEVLDLRMACLDRRLDRLDATLEVLEDADEAVVEQALGVVTGLPSLSRCADVDALRAAVPPPDDSAVAQAVARAQRELVRAEARTDLGRHAEALSMIEALPPAALGHPPLQVEVAALRGLVLTDLARYDEAEQVLRQAFPVALRIDHRRVAAAMMSSLAFVVGARKMREAESALLSDTALALAEQLGDGPLRAKVLNERAGVLDAHAHYDEAVARYEQVVAVQQRLYAPDSLVLATTLSNLALALRHRGDLEQAFQIRQRLLAIEREKLGDHPNTARTLNAIGNLLHMRGDYSASAESLTESVAMNMRLHGPDHLDTVNARANLGMAHSGLGQHAQAEQNLRQALQVLERDVGIDNLEVIDTMHNLGIAVEEQGRHAEALGLHQRTLEALERTTGPDHPRTAISLNNVAGSLVALHREAEAEPLLQRAATILRDKAGPDHPHVALVEVTLADALLALDRADEAEPLLRHASALIEQHFGEEHVYLGYALSSLGWAIHLRGGDRQEALGLLERSVALVSAADPPPAKQAQALMTQARVLGEDPVQLGRARELARRAREHYEAAGEGSASDRRAVDAWLAEHP